MWPTLPLLLVYLLAAATRVCHLLSPLRSTWTWSESRGVWSRCGWPFLWWADGAGRRRDSPRRTSTGVCNSWSWPAGTQRCAPAPDPKKTTTHCRRTGVCVFVSMQRLVFSWQDTDLIVVLHHDQSEATLFKVQSSDFWPEQHKARSICNKIRVQWCSSNTSMRCDFYCESLQICFSADLKSNYELLLKQFHLLECTFRTTRQKMVHFLHPSPV